VSRRRLIVSSDWIAPMALKSHIQAGLSRAALFERMKASLVYDLYCYLADRSRIETRSREVEFYRGVLAGLPKNGLIFDVGANHGAKTDVFLRLGARVVAIEPDEGSQALLAEKFLKFRLVPRPVVVVGKAVSDAAGFEPMWIDGPGSALNTLSPKWVELLKGHGNRFQHQLDKLEFSARKTVETTTVEQLVAAHGTPFYIKIDVEGHELRVLRGLQRPIPFVSFEVNLPDFKPEGLECLSVLDGLAPKGRFNYTADCLAGLALPDWLAAEDFAKVLLTCEGPAVEVFWRSNG
jgi:FkbM family methyltransferase